MQTMNMSNTPKGRMRWWIPAAIIALAVANVIRVRAPADLDLMIKNLRTFLTVVVSFLLLLIWWLFLTRLRWRTRLAGLGIVVLCAVGLKQLVRIDGSENGAGLPRIVWRWTPRKSGEVGEFKTGSKAGFISAPIPN